MASDLNGSLEQRTWYERHLRLAQTVESSGDEHHEQLDEWRQSWGVDPVAARREHEEEG